MSDDERTCSALQLIAELQRLVSEHGDLPVFVRDADTSYRLPLGLMFREAQPLEDRPKRFEICSEYFVRPRGDFYTKR